LTRKLSVSLRFSCAASSRAPPLYQLSGWRLWAPFRHWRPIFAIRRQTKSRAGQVADRIHQETVLPRMGKFMVYQQHWQYQSNNTGNGSSKIKYYSNFNTGTSSRKDKPFHGRPVASKLRRSLMGGTIGQGGA
jgi:hypothetical protein